VCVCVYVYSYTYTHTHTHTMLPGGLKRGAQVKGESSSVFLITRYMTHITHITCLSTACRPPQVIINGDDSRLDVLKQHLRALEDKEVNVRRTLEVGEGEEQELRTKHSEVSKLKTDLADEKAMYDTKQADIVIKKKEKEIQHLASEIERYKKLKPELKRKLDQTQSLRLEEAKKLKLLTDKLTEVTIKALIAGAKAKPMKDDYQKCLEALRAAQVCRMCRNLQDMMRIVYYIHILTAYIPAHGAGGSE
jgi:hypothetical protein